MRAAILIRRIREVVNSAVRLGLGNGVADPEHQPIGTGVQHEADLIGERRAATRASLPAHASMLCNHCEMLVALPCCRFIRNRRYAWWNDDCCSRMTLGNNVVDDLAIVCPVCCHRRNVNIDLIK